MIIDGKKIALTLLEELHGEVLKLPFQPIFCDILVGNDPVSLSYVAIKKRIAERIGIKFQLAHYDESVTEEKLLSEIAILNAQKDLCGLIIQLPVPQHLVRQEILDAIDPSLDVDCLGYTNTKIFYSGKGTIIPPTAHAIMELLKQTSPDLHDKNIVVVGKGILVGKPTVYLLESLGYSVTVLDKAIEHIEMFTAQADVLISGTGQAGLITGDIIKRGSIIIDAGTAEMDGGIVGDVNFESVFPIAGYISPVPGGVGPVTVAMLLNNVVEVAKLKR